MRGKHGQETLYCDTHRKERVRHGKPAEGRVVCKCVHALGTKNCSQWSATGPWVKRERVFLANMIGVKSGLVGWPIKLKLRQSIHSLGIC